MWYVTMSKRRTCLITSVLALILLVTIATLVLSTVIMIKFDRNNGMDQDQDHAPITDAPAPAPPLDWWKYTPIYQIYPRSFQDSDGDGTGDLNGIRKRVQYIYELGIKAIWLSPIYESPFADYGYDISNFTEIAPVFGTIDDFKGLLEEVHKYGMYLIMDFVPNHSSDQHPWFQKSLRGEAPYDQYYVWRDEPNNWISVFGNSSWEYVPSRGQYYLHQFLIQQPDLNYRNPTLREEMVKALKYWAELGVDGFRIDSVMYLVEDAEFRNEYESGLDLPPNEHDYLYHNYTENLPESLDVVTEWAKFFHDFGTARGKHIFSCTEAYTDIGHVMQFYTTGVDIAFNFNLVYWDSWTSATGLHEMIRSWMDRMPAGAWPNWVMGNHDNHRVASRLGGREYIDIANMLLLLLPGTPTCYYGDEIGMMDGNISYADSVDPSGCKWGPDAYMNFSRDPERTPMQWDTSNNSGFSSGKPWLPLGEDWQIYNVQEESKAPNSHLSVFKALVKLRQELTFKLASNLRLIELDDENVFAFARESDEGKYVIVLNVGYDGAVSQIDHGLATGHGRILIRSANADLHMDSRIDFKQPFQISNAQGYVIKLD